MEATLLSVGKSVLNGALGYAKSTIAKEVALQLGVWRDHDFITDELEMMQGFLSDANNEGNDDKVVRIWVKQVRDVSGEVENCLLDFAVRLDKQSWWRFPRTLLDRRHVAQRMKELQVKVKEVNERNLRYHLLNGASGSNPTSAATEQSNEATTMLFGTDEARYAMNLKKTDLVELINKKDDDLSVISVWGTGGDIGLASFMRASYENEDLKMKFPCRAWVRVMHPFSPTEFVQSLLKQFRAAVLGIDGLLEAEKTGQDLAQEYKGYVNENSYLIVLTDLCTIEEWDQIKVCFPNNKKGSRIIVSTMQVEIANLCAGRKSIVSELKQVSADQTIYAFHDQDVQDKTYYSIAWSRSISITATTIANVPACIKLMVAASEASHLIGREEEKAEIINTLVSNHGRQGLQVISVWGMGGIGKTTLVEDIYRTQEVRGKFEKHAYVTVTRPFILEELLRSLSMQLDAETSDKEDPMDLVSRHLEGKRFLIVLNDLSSTKEWNLIYPVFPREENSRIIVTTRQQDVASYCSLRGNKYNLKYLADNDVHSLFTTKVFKKTIDLEEKYPELVEAAALILRKCGGHPLAIVTIGNFMANQSKTVEEWMKFNEHISAERGTISGVITKSYDGLPYHLKSCLLYMSIFCEGQKVSRRRLVRRWSAEGYLRVVQVNSWEETTENYFMELISRNMLLPSQLSVRSTTAIDSCQVHDIIRGIGISKSKEENLVFTLDEGSGLNRVDTVCHLAISSKWEGDQSEFETIVDISRIRSLTVFGKWRSFFISQKMRLLQVLDLEDTTGLVDRDLEHIGSFLHLRYLSLRGCLHIYQLPDSLGNLRLLQTLDIAGTSIFKLPRSIVKLIQLQHILAGAIKVQDGNDDVETSSEDVPMLMRNRLCVSAFSSVALCVGCCAPHDACCCSLLPASATHQGVRGVAIPRGICKLKALHTLGTVNIAWRKAALEEIRRLRWLRKLRVTGINKRNSQELCSTIARLRSLESLLIESEGKTGLSGCLDDLWSLPEDLQSLKLYGNMVTLPRWMDGLRNLEKLKLRSSRILECDTAIKALGGLPNLVILRLWKESFDGDEIRISFPAYAFPSLMVLELDRVGDLKSVEFEEKTTPRLELLQFRGSPKAAKVVLFSGLQHLQRFKEFKLVGAYEPAFVADLQEQLGMNQNLPVLKSY